MLSLLLRGTEIALGLAAVLFVASLLASGMRDPSRAAADLRHEPLVLSLLDADALVVSAGDHHDVAFDLESDGPCTVTGRVVGLTGGRKDVEVYVLDENGYADWANGIRPDAVFASGRASSTALEVPLSGLGRYHLLLSNRFSLLTDKVVQVRDARVTCL